MSQQIDIWTDVRANKDMVIKENELRNSIQEQVETERKTLRQLANDKKLEIKENESSKEDFYATSTEKNPQKKVVVVEKQETSRLSTTDS